MGETVDIRKLIDPRFSQLYFFHNGHKHSVQLRRVDKQFLYVDNIHEIESQKRLQIQLFVSNGILSCSVLVQKKHVVSDRLDFIPLKVIVSTIQHENRREFFRLSQGMDTVTMIQVSDESHVPIRIIDLSAGGLGFIAREELELQSICCFKVFFNILNFDLEWIPFQIIRKEETGNDDFSYGGQFILNEKISNHMFTNEQQNKIVAFINRQQIRQNKI